MASSESINSSTIDPSNSPVVGATPKPWDLAGLRQSLVSYALIGVQDEWENLEQREAQIAAQLQQLEAEQTTGSKLRRLVASDAVRYLHGEQENLIQRRAELRTQWQALQAEAASSRILIAHQPVVENDEDALLSAAFKAVLGGITVGAPVLSLAGLGLMALVMSATLGWILAGVYVGAVLGTILGGAAGHYAHLVTSEARSRAIPLLEAAS